MYKLFFLSAVLLLNASSNAQTAGYPQSKDGFRSQLDAIVQHYRAGDTATGRRLIDQFRLPNSEQWFTEYLGPEQSAKLTERYGRLFANFAESLEKTIEAVVAHRESDLVTDLDEGKGESPSSVRRPGAKLSGIVSVKHPSLSYGHFIITLKTKESQSWADTLVYEDGAFRFLGFGAWPFWVWEDGSEGEAPKGGSFSEPPTLIAQVSPVYPSSAKARGIEGVVTVLVHVDKEGRVTKADVLSGDPLLTQAALDAVRQWRFKPGTFGGAPAESNTMVGVNFKLH